MNTTQLIRCHERAIELLEMIAQEKKCYRSHKENADHFLHIGLHALSEKETHRAILCRMSIKKLTKSYENSIEKFNKQTTTTICI